MNEPFLLMVAGSAFFFYALVPIVGAVAVRAQWRLFRAQVERASLLPQLSFAESRRVHLDISGQSFRLMGSLEAVRGDSVIYLSKGDWSVAVDLEKVPLFVLPPRALSRTRWRGELPDQTPAALRWGQLSALPEGTTFLVAGRLSMVRGEPTFRSVPGEPLLVVIYDCPDADLLPRALWTGRQRNEYWNVLTLPSLAGGFLTALLIAFVAAPQSRLGALVAVTAALIPFLPLLPPGIVGFYLYRRLWQRGRRLRAQRDLLRMPTRYSFTPSAEGAPAAPLPDGGIYQCTILSGPPAEEDVALVIAGSEHELPEDAAEQYYLYRQLPAGPLDPMATSIAVAGDPAKRAAHVHWAARAWETAGVISILSGIALNALIAAAILRAILM